jgi:hypothetical protein
MVGALLYIGSYFTFSYQGRYQEVTIEGGIQYAVWFPRSFGYVSRQPKQQFRLHPDALIFSPLIFLDRRFIHPTTMTYSMNGDGHRIASISKDGKQIQTEQGAAANP